MSISSSDVSDCETQERCCKGYGLLQFLSKYKSPAACVPTGERYLVHRANLVCEVNVLNNPLRSAMDKERTLYIIDLG